MTLHVDNPLVMVVTRGETRGECYELIVRAGNMRPDIALVSGRWLAAWHVIGALKALCYSVDCIEWGDGLGEVRETVAEMLVQMSVVAGVSHAAA